MAAGVDQLLRRVHERLGGGLDIQTFADGTVEVRWRGAYGEELSTERFASSASLRAALEAVLEQEDAADAADLQAAELE
jgi:hypothetical protein